MVLQNRIDTVHTRSDPTIRSNIGDEMMGRQHHQQQQQQQQQPPRLKYSRVVCGLSCILISCVIFLIISNFFLLFPAATIEAATTPRRHHAGLEKTTNTTTTNYYYYLPPINNSIKMKHSMSWKLLDHGSIFSPTRNQPQHRMKQIPTALPLPIFVMNMPKSGSTTIHQYFLCGMGGRLHSVHNAYNTKFMDPAKVPYVHPDMLHRVATCMAHNLMLDRPLIYGCGGFSVWTDAGDVVSDTKNSTRTLDFPDTFEVVAPTKAEIRTVPMREYCFYPGVHGLENIAKYYPYATILHLPRNATNWITSSTGWSKSMVKVGTNSSHEYEAAVARRKAMNSNPGNSTTGTNDAVVPDSQKGKQKGLTILDRYERKCNGFEGNTFHSSRQKRMENRPSSKHKTNDEWKVWYERDYTERIRGFAVNHPTLTYFESPLDDPDTPDRLERVTGISATKCFGHSLKTADRLKRWAQKNEEANKSSTTNLKSKH